MKSGMGWPTMAGEGFTSGLAGGAAGWACWAGTACPGLALEQDDHRADGQDDQGDDEDGGFLLVDHGRISFERIPLLETTRPSESSHPALSP
ncbi:MAG: hypothetical protein MZV70_70780 [Desulfobacterales bacterium]|nr:hypothetical protein [Desulfobacterales bacterium]